MRGPNLAFTSIPFTGLAQRAAFHQLWRRFAIGVPLADGYLNRSDAHTVESSPAAHILGTVASIRQVALYFRYLPERRCWRLRYR